MPSVHDLGPLETQRCLIEFPDKKTAQAFKGDAQSTYVFAYLNGEMAKHLLANGSNVTVVGEPIVGETYTMSLEADSDVMNQIGLANQVLVHSSV